MSQASGDPAAGTVAGMIAWVDASVGVAGDMLLGALLDAGAQLGEVQRAVDAVVPDTVRLTAAAVVRGGMRATKAGVALTAPDQHHRRWSEIRGRIEGAPLAPRVRARALSAFGALARVEAEAHGVDVEDVHFHEVGAWDSIADVVGVCAALELLGVDTVVVSPIGVGSGSVRGAHGRIPVPVPAVVGLAAGWEVDSVGEGELATPTGVALVTTLATSQGPLPRMRVLASGMGAGTKEVEGRANVVRVVLGSSPQRAASDDGTGPSDLVVLEANVDDLDPRVWPTVIESLLAAGAADAWLTPIVMKRGRPAHTLSVLVHPADAARLRELVLATTPTIGVRETAVRRWALPRAWADVTVGGCPVAVKVAHRDGTIVRATPEFRDVEAAAAALGRPVGDLLDAAVAAAVARGLVPGGPLPSDVRTQP